MEIVDSHDVVSKYVLGSYCPPAFSLTGGIKKAKYGTAKAPTVTVADPRRSKFIVHLRSASIVSRFIGRGNGVQGTDQIRNSTSFSEPSRREKARAALLLAAANKKVAGTTE